jgi:hypothetical protein
LKAKRTAPVPLAHTAGTPESGTEANAPFYTAPSGRLGAWQAQQLAKFEGAQAHIEYRTRAFGVRMP